MKSKRFVLIALIVVSVMTFNITANAASAENWYIVKKANSIPSFPETSKYLREHSCYFIDEASSESGEKRLYLTFDAGYENGNVEGILDVLSEKHVKGAFFVLSNLIRKNTELVKRMAEDGHLVCNHTKNHKDMTTLTSAEMKDNLEALEALYADYTGYEMSKYFRYPEGRYSLDTVNTAEDLGYKTFFWSAAYADWDNQRQPSTDAAKRALLSQTHPGAIILLHPTSETNLRVLPELIDEWRAMGYTFGTLDEIIERNS